MFAKRYPPATWLGNGRRYGSLTTQYPHCFIAHSTETAGLPGYDSGNSAPHMTYHPLTRVFYQHQDQDAWVGALKRGNGPISANAKAHQLEIIAYSDKAIADLYGRLWIGNLPDWAYEDISDYLVWLYREGWISSLDVWMPGPTWKYGAGSPYRLSWPSYLDFPGVTAHGAVPDNDHWNTGVMDLHRLGMLARLKLGGFMGHPATDYQQWTAEHQVGGVLPQWAIDAWRVYRDNGGSTVEESVRWGAIRADIAWVYSRFIRPLEARVANLESALSALQSSTAAQIASLNARVASLEAGGGGVVPQHSHVTGPPIGG